MPDISILNGYKIKDKKAIRFYNTIADMKADTTIKEGMHIKTSGYYNINDGGHADYKIINDNTLVEDHGSLHLLNNGLFAKLINTECLNPQMFGAHGYRAVSDDRGITYDNEYDPTKEDSTQALQNTIKYAKENNIRNIELLGLIYNCKGDNAFGLPRFTEYIEEKQYYYTTLNVDGKGATFYWDSEDSDLNNFSFVGYLRYSNWKNFKIRCLNNNKKGNIFSTNYKVENQPHLFSCNRFENISINVLWSRGSCNKVIDFSIDGTSTHDDLSVFDKILATSYINFFYTNNQESVHNVFQNCSTNGKYSDSIDFFIDCTSGSWYGYLTINNHHYTALNEENQTFIKTSPIAGITNAPFPIELNNCRMEKHGSKFQIANLGAYQLYIKNIKITSSFTQDETHPYLELKPGASCEINNCFYFPTTIKLHETTSTGLQSFLKIINSSFANSILNVTPHIIFNNFESIEELRQSETQYYFQDISINNGFSSLNGSFINNYMVNPLSTKKNHAHLINNGNNPYFDCGALGLVIENLKLYTESTTATKAQFGVYSSAGGQFILKNVNLNNGVADFTEGNELQRYVLPSRKASEQNYLMMRFRLLDVNNEIITGDKMYIDFDYRATLYNSECNIYNPQARTTI